MHAFLKKTLVFIAASACCTWATAQKTSNSYAQRDEAQAFVNEVAAREHIDRGWLQAAVNQTQFNARVQSLMTPRTGPAGVKNWRAYRGRFVEPIRIRAGLRFWQDNADTLARAEKEFGVPAEIIAGIIGVETIYGQQMGGFSVADALATLAFDFPSSHPRAAERAAYFRRELEQFLTNAYLTRVDPFEAKGSYAGAMGIPQFMPSSWAAYAVDYDGDGRIDLFNSPADAIGSVANYFVGHGWKRGLPTHYRVQVDSNPQQLATLLAPDIKPSFSAAEMQANGAPVQGDGAANAGPLALIELKNGSDATSYVAGTQNFYVVTRYNWSSFYAMSVIELGQAIRQARSSGTVPAAEPETTAEVDPSNAVAAGYAAAWRRSRQAAPAPAPSN
ncbi:MAG: lytic murein transglycosylase B [Comamonas sp.]